MKFSAFRFNPAAQAFAPSHLGIACKPALPSVWRRFRFLTPSKNRKTKSFPLSAFRFQFILLILHQIKVDMKFKEGYKVRSMAGENVVIMQGTAGSDMTRIISLNDSSLLLWNELQGKEFEVADVANILVENYGIDLATAERDAKAWVEKLQECNLIS